MLNKSKLKNRKYLIILLSCMSIAVVSIIGMFSVAISNNTKLTMQKAKSKAEYFARMNDTRTYTAKHILSAMQIDGNVQEYVNNPNRYCVIAIRNKLGFFTAIEDTFRLRLEIIDPQANLYISSDTITYNYSAYGEYTEDSGYVLHDDYTDVYFKVPYYENKSLIFVCKLYKNIEYFLLTENDENYFTFCYKDMIYGDSSRIPDTPVPNDGFTRIGNKIAYAVSSQNNAGFKYVYMRSNSLPPLTVFILVIISVLLLIFSYILAGFVFSLITKAIKDVTRKISVATDIPICGDSTEDIDFIIDKLNDTFRSLNEIKQANIDNRELLMHKHLADLYSGILPKNNIDRLLRGELSIINKMHTLISVMIINEKELADEYSADGIAYIRNDIIDMVCGKLEEVYYFVDGLNSFTIITTDDTKKITAMVNELAEILLMQFHITMKVCIGQTICGYNNSLKSYNNIKQLVSNILFLESDDVIFKENEAITNKVFSMYSINIEQQIISLFTEEQFDSAKVLIENIVLENVTGASSNASLYKLKTAFGVTIQRIADSLNINVDGIMHTDIQFTKMSAEQIRAAFMDMFDRLACEIRSIGTPADNDYTRIYDFINNNINKDISLNDLSEYLGYSVWKTSRKFKNIFNENFKTYVIMRKMNVAKELLLQDYPVTEVAAAIGCNSSGTFIRMFKSNVGMTPGEFKSRKNRD